MCRPTHTMPSPATSLPTHTYGANLHYDDLYSGTVAPTPNEAEHRLVDGLTDLRRVVEDDLQATIAPHKAIVVGSDWGLQRNLTRRLRDLGGHGSGSHCSKPRGRLHSR